MRRRTGAMLAVAAAAAALAAALDAAVPEAEVLDVPEGSNRLALEFYRQVSAGEGNVLFSPPALYMALAALYEEADGEPAAQIQRLLALEPDRQKRHEAVSRFVSDVYYDSDRVRSVASNALWLPVGASAGGAYLDSAGAVYGMDPVPTGAGAGEIGVWADESTSVAISSEGIPPPAASGAVLASLAAFEGEWNFYHHPTSHRAKPWGNIELAETGDGVYRIVVNNDTKYAHYLTQRDYFDHAYLDDVVLVRLPYADGRTSMIIISANDANEPRSIEESLTVETIERWKSKMAVDDFEFNIPRFKIESTYDLRGVLGNMGITGIFDPGSSLPGMAGAGPGIHVSGAVQKAFINMTKSSIGEQDLLSGIRTDDVPKKSFSAIRPFTFIIQDDKTGTILFMGRVSDIPGTLRGELLGDFYR